MWSQVQNAAAWGSILFKLRLVSVLLLPLVCAPLALSQNNPNDFSEVDPRNAGSAANPTDNSAPNAASSAPKGASSGEEAKPVATDAADTGLTDKPDTARKPQDLQGLPLNLTSPTNTATETTSDLGSSGIWGVVIALLILGVTGAIVVIVVRRSPRLRNLVGGGPIKVLSRAYLGPRQAVVLVKVGDRVVLVGQTPESMHPLTEFSDSGEVQRLLDQVEETRSDSMSNTFRDVLRASTPGARARRKAENAGAAPRATASSPLSARDIELPKRDSPEIARSQRISASSQRRENENSTPDANADELRRLATAIEVARTAAQAPQVVDEAPAPQSEAPVASTMATPTASARSAAGALAASASTDPDYSSQVKLAAIRAQLEKARART